MPRHFRQCESQADYHAEYHGYRARKHVLWGMILIIAGGIFMADRLGIVDAGDAWHFWPAVIGLLGLAKIVSARNPGHVVKGGFHIAFAFWLYACIEHLWGWMFGANWPVIVIAFGASIVLRGLLNTSRNSNEESAR